MEADPIGLDGGLNPDAYAGSNPVMFTDSSGLKLDMLDNAGLSMVAGLNNSLDQMILNQQINQLNRSSTMRELSDRELSNVTGQMGYGGSNKQGGWKPQTVVDRKYISESLQTIGDAADGAAVGCAFSVICAPAAPAIGFVGFSAGTAGTLLDPEASTQKKVVSLIVPSIAGKLGEKVVTNSAIGDAVASAYGTIVDKLTGKTIDATYECRQKKTC